MSQILPRIAGPADLRSLSDEQLLQLAQEMRDELVRVLSVRPAHFASNLGVVELCLALHLTFDFSKDRLIWDTGHQIYPHKLITGRYQRFHTIRTRGGLMGYPNPEESPYDLFMTGHAGCATSAALGLKVADDLLGRSDRHSVAVVGDGALPSGIVFEALNNAGDLKKKFLVVLNDNKMSICPRVGALASCLDRARLTNFYQGSKRRLKRILDKLPFIGKMANQAVDQVRDALKALLTGGMLFEELGFHYVGPIDGHDLTSLRYWLNQVKDYETPVLLHVLTVKGQGVPQASSDPVTFHTPPVFEKVGPGRTIVSLKGGGARSYTDAVSSAI
ncbi:MAG: thiamine pyrophosphate-dependent enzyme, partial [Gemmataceae bacterium]|nr:thiamine pyrophosphate-dependent enzyme [Gemmataceae bacterium]